MSFETQSTKSKVQVVQISSCNSIYPFTLLTEDEKTCDSFIFIVHIKNNTTKIQITVKYCQFLCFY